MCKFTKNKILVLNSSVSNPFNLLRFTHKVYKTANCTAKILNIVYALSGNNGMWMFVQTPPRLSLNTNVYLDKVAVWFRVYNLKLRIDNEK